MQRSERVRAVVNAANLSTGLGLAVARASGADVVRGPAGLLLASGGGLRRLRPAALTLGDVVLLRETDLLVDRPELLAHEHRHAMQYAWCAGLPFLPLYALASLWSYLRCGDAASANLFERHAGLAAGGYEQHPPRRRRGRGAPVDIHPTGS